MNQNGVVYTPDSNNSWIGAFRSGVESFPIVGPLVAGLISPSLTANYVKQIEGDVIDTRTGWQTEQRLFVAALVLLAILIYLKRKG